MAESSTFKVDSVSRTTVSTMGDAATLVFNAEDGGEVSIRLPFEVVADSMAALVHAQRMLVLKRQALGAGETPNLLHVKSVKARDLPDRQFHLQLNTDNGISFHFHVSTNLAQMLATALGEWLAQNDAAGNSGERPD
jgi:hypothetical protein